MKKALGRIYLTGYMASGKSTIAKLVAKSMNLDFVDMDDLIVERAGMSIPDIFSKYGESAFRRLEASALYQCTKMNDVVIATGGGAPCFHGNQEIMNETGVSIYLNLTVDQIIKRLEGEKSRRPLVATKSSDELITYVNVHLNSRKEYYEKAKFIVDGSQTPEAIVVEIRDLMGS